MTPFVANSRASHAPPSAAMATLSIGLYSSHSPGRVRALAIRRGGVLARRAAAPCAPVRGRGAVSHAIQIVTTISTSVSAIDCHRKIVWLNGITPVIASRAGGMLAGFACNCAADEDSPIAQTEPRPR